MYSFVRSSDLRLSRHLALESALKRRASPGVRRTVLALTHLPPLSSHICRRLFWFADSFFAALVPLARILRFRRQVAKQGPALASVSSAPSMGL